LLKSKLLKEVSKLAISTTYLQTAGSRWSTNSS